MRRERSENNIEAHSRSLGNQVCREPCWHTAILDPNNTASDVWTDSAYRSAEIEAKLKDKGLKSGIHRKSRRNKPLTKREMQGNKTRSKVRARVEHVFGAQSNDMGGTLVRSIGLKNPAYNMRSLVQLDRIAMVGFP